MFLPKLYHNAKRSDISCNFFILQKQTTFSRAPPRRVSIVHLGIKDQSGGKLCQTLPNVFKCYESKTMDCDDEMYKDYIADVKVAALVVCC